MFYEKKYGMSNTVEIQIHSLSHDGRGIGIAHDKTTFVSGALPNERVKCKIIKKHSRYLEAETIEIITPAAERITPACQHFSICGGCSLQHMANDAQLQFKQKTLLEQLKHFGNVTPEAILPPISGSLFEYRQKARLGVRYVKKKERLLVGFREKNSNYLADLKECLILHPSVGQKISVLSEFIASLKQYEHIPQIEVAVGNAQTALVFRHMVDLPAEDIVKFIEFAKKHNLQIYLQPNPPKPIHKIWPEDKQELLNYQLTAYDLTFQFHPLDFTQINGEINPLMIQQALILLDIQPHEHVLDLFCGLGNFTLPIARFAKHVTGIEGSLDMIMRAKQNAELNRLSNTAFYTSNLMQVDQSFPWLQQPYDKILLDPPRTGAKEIISLLANINAKQIVYVSCNPATFARDAGELVHQQKYALKKVGLINMFPHTNHTETIAMFEKL